MVGLAVVSAVFHGQFPCSEQNVIRRVWRKLMHCNSLAEILFMLWLWDNAFDMQTSFKFFRVDNVTQLKQIVHKKI